MTRSTILLIEDDPAVRHGLAAFMRASGIEVDEAETCRTALDLFREGRHEVVDADYSLPDGTSLDLLPDFKRLSEDTPFIILTAHGSIDLAVRAIKEGAEQFLTKTEAEREANEYRSQLGDARGEAGQIIDELGLNQLRKLDVYNEARRQAAQVVGRNQRDVSNWKWVGRWERLGRR